MVEQHEVKVLLLLPDSRKSKHGHKSKASSLTSTKSAKTHSEKSMEALKTEDEEVRKDAMIPKGRSNTLFYTSLSLLVTLVHCVFLVR